MSEQPARDALVVAGGRGTRLQPLTYTTRKELQPFCGQPFLLGVVRRLAAAAVERVHLVVGAETASFGPLEAAARDLGVAVECVPEPEPLDTAGGVRAVVSRLRAPFLVLNGDILTDLDVAAAVAHHRRTGADATVVLTRVADTSSYGVAVRDGTRVTRFVEKPPPGTLPEQDAVNAGTYVLEPHVLEPFAAGPLSFEREVFPGLLERGGHLEGFAWEGVWADLGTPERYRHGHRLALDGRLPWPSLLDVPEAEPGIRRAPDAHVADEAVLRPPVLVLAGAEIASRATVGPHAVVGAGARLDPGAVVTDSVLQDGVVLGEEVVADGLVAGARARVDAGARLGRGAVLGEGEVLTAGEVLAEGERRPPARG